MDPMTIATVYATIMGLICNFRRERKDQKDLNNHDFTEWLAGQHREDLKEFIIRSTELPSEIDKLLKQDMEELLSMANEMRAALSSLPGSIDGLAQTIQTSQSQSDRLRMLFQLIEKQEQTVRSLEAKGLFLPRNHPDTEWELPIDVSSLKSAYAQFESMHVEDMKHWSFPVYKDASVSKTVEVTQGNRVELQKALLNALAKLIKYREELDYLDEVTKTRRQ